MAFTCSARKAGETYIDASGNKVVEPVYNGAGGTVGGTIRVVK